MSVFAWIYVWASMCIPIAQRSQKRALDSQKMDFIIELPLHPLLLFLKVLLSPPS